MVNIADIKSQLSLSSSSGFTPKKQGVSAGIAQLVSTATRISSAPSSSSSSSSPSSSSSSSGQAVKINFSSSRESSSGSSAPSLTAFNRNGGTSGGDAPTATQNAGNRQEVNSGGTGGFFSNTNRREAISQGFAGSYSVKEANRQAIKSESQIQVDSKGSGLKEVIASATKVTASSTNISQSVQSVIDENTAAKSPSIEDVAKALASAKPVNQLKPGGSL